MLIGAHNKKMDKRVNQKNGRGYNEKNGSVIKDISYGILISTV